MSDLSHMRREPASENDHLPDVGLNRSEANMKMTKVNKTLNSGRQLEGQIRLVKLRQNESNTKLGFSLRGGKESTGSSVGVFVSHVERSSEADSKGLKIGDQLIQVNGLDVNQATYEEVIGLIKRTPKRSDISLEVTNLGRIPFQEKSGDSIKWLQVTDLLCEHDDEEAENDDQFDGGGLGHNTMRNSGEQHETVKGSSLSSSDEGIESCESHRGTNSLSGGESETDSQQRRRHIQKEPQTVTLYHNHRHIHHHHQQQEQNQSQRDETISTNNSTSLTFTSTDDNCSSSSCSLSISSASSSSCPDDPEESDKIRGAKLVEYHDQQINQRISLVRVPGGNLTSEPFGCGVVKGPEEWPGIFVQNVKPASLAERVGLEPGDELVRADGHSLAGLSFEASVKLIKQLQQQQDELQLEVKKGAALEYLAASSKQQRAIAGVQRAQTKSEEASRSGAQVASSGGGGGTATQMDLVERRPVWKLAPTDSVQRKRASGDQQPEQREQVQSSRNDRRDPSKPKPPTSASASNAALGSQSCKQPLDCAGREKPPASNGAYQSAGGRAAADAKGESLKSNPISGTKTQLSGKLDQHDNGSSDNSRYNYDEDDAHCQGSATGGSGKAAKNRLCDRANMERLEPSDRFSGDAADCRGEREVLVENCKTSGLTNQLERGNRLEEVHFIQKSAKEKQQVNRGGEQVRAGSRCAANTATLQSATVSGQSTASANRLKIALLQERHQQIDHHIHRDCLNQNKKRNQKDKLDLNGNHIASNTDEKRCSGDSNDSAIKPEDANMMAAQRYPQDHLDGPHDQQVGATKQLEQEEEEIRIVRQNCKLHQTHHQSALHQIKSGHVHEKFPHPAAKLQLQLKHQQQRHDAEREARKGLIRRPQLIGSDCSSNMRQKQVQLTAHGRPMLHRYVSMDNLPLIGVQPVAGCPSVQANKQLHGQCRGNPSSSRQQKYIADMELYANGLHYSRSGLMPDSLGSECSLPSPSLRPHRLYRRSNSTMQNCLCCAKPNHQNLGDSMQCQASGIQYNLLATNQCCSQRQLQSQQQQQQLAYTGKRYSSTLGSSLALSRTKAQSMDKLNMNISLNYVKIGLNSPYRQVKQVNGAIGSGPSSAQGQHRPQRSSSSQRRQLATESCCSAQQVVARQQTIYNYATAARMISSGAAQIRPAMQPRRQRQTGCCPNQIRPNHCQDCLYAKEAANRCASMAIKNVLCPDAQHLGKANKRPDCCDCCESSMTCCCRRRLTDGLQDLACTADQRRQDLRAASKLCSMNAISDTGAATDCSSGYLSGGRTKDDSCPEQRLYPSRLLKLCSVAPPPPPPPPAPPMLLSSSGNLAPVISSQRDTRQRLSTFLSPSPSHNSRGDSCSPLAKTDLMTGNGRTRTQVRQQLASANVSPTSCSSSYSPCSLVSITATSDSSLTASSLISATADDLATGSCKPSTGRPILIGHHQKLSSPASTERAKAGSRHAVPCPPPLPASDFEFDCKIKRILKQQDHRLVPGRKLANACGGRDYHRNKKQVDNGGRDNNDGEADDDDDQGDEEDLQSSATTDSNGKQNRLCFVDELKMLAKRQQSSAANLPMDSSATLIKIINASKSASVLRKECNCGATGQQRDGTCQERSGKQSRPTNGCHRADADCQPHHPQKSMSKPSGYNRSAHNESKSVKLDDEDNKRRQHEMLMKEFKSAHSKMFSRRRNNTNLEGDEEMQSNQQLQTSSSEKQPAPKRTTTTTAIKALHTNKLSNLLPPSQVHLAAAN